MRVLLRAAFDRYSGYGNDAVDMALFLADRGIDVTPLPESLLPGLPKKFTNLLTKDPTGPHDVVMSFMPPFDLRPWEYTHLAKVSVAYSMWERSRLTRRDMVDHGWDMRRKTTWWSGGGVQPEDRYGRNRPSLDQLIVTCPMNVEAFSALDPHTPIDVIPCGVDTKLFPEMDRSLDGPMRFAMCGMLAGRKDPFTMLQAWRELKAEHADFDAVLELKTSCPGLHPDLVNVYPDVVLHDRAWPQQQLIDWYGTIDVMVSVSRGEGNNKPCMEFMSTGGTCIASDWSGHQNWLHPSCTWAVGGVLLPVSDRDPDVLDFRVDVETLKETILAAWRDPAATRQKGRFAARWIRQSLSWEAVCEKLERKFMELMHG